MGLLWHERRQWDEAITHYQQAVEEKPEHAAAYRCLGKAFQEQQRWDEAIVCFQRALELKPRDVDSAANLGVAFEQQEQFALAAESYAQALAIQPHAQTRIRLATVLRHVGRLSEALQLCDALIEQEPDHTLAHWTRAQILLQQRDFQRGWQEYSWRWRLPNQSEPAAHGIPVWDGASLAGKSILVHGEAALADMLMLMPCLTPVVEQARRAVLTCDAQLVGLVARTYPTVEVSPIDAHGLQPALPPCDVQIALARLPGLLQFDSAAFQSNRVPLAAGSVDGFLRNPLPVSEKPASTPRVGILWRSRFKANVQPGTSRAPALEHWQPLLNTPGVQFLGLLPDATDDELARLCGSNGNLIAMPHTSDIDMLAAQLGELDLLIAVDDLTPHLAASLNREVWLVLPHAWGWQWPLGQERCPWYSSVRLLRPRRPSAWPELISRLTQQLSAWLAGARQAAIDAEHRHPNRPHGLTPGQTALPLLTMQHGAANHQSATDVQG
jgi:Tfp pilus assembly protein PilF